MTSASANEIPDPITFASDALTARGALVERLNDGCVAILPPALARELALPEACTLAPVMGESQGDTVSCAIGSPLLDRLGEAVRGSVPFAALASAAEAPRIGQARSLAERLVLRNAVFEVNDAGFVDTSYFVGWFAWKAEADDRYDGIFALAIHSGDGSEPDSLLATLVDRASGADGPPGLSPASERSRATLELLARRATSRARGKVAPACAAVARRHERDHRRIEEYFSALVRDARAPKRRLEAEAIERKVSHLLAERASKLRDLRERYAIRVSLEPIALVALTVSAVQVRLHVRRRKREGDLVLHLPSTAGSLDRLTCAACGDSTARPAVCDDALHVLCEDCMPQAQGRPECRACRPPRPG